MVKIHFSTFSSCTLSTELNQVELCSAFLFGLNLITEQGRMRKFYGRIRTDSFTRETRLNEIYLF